MKYVFYHVVIDRDNLVSFASSTTACVAARGRSGRAISSAHRRLPMPFQLR